jgi:DNA-binding response OmpR family regulator
MNPFRLLILAKESAAVRELVNSLIYRGFSCNFVSSEQDLDEANSADLLLIEMDGGFDYASIEDITQRIRQTRHMPIVLLAEKVVLREIENDTNIDDFVLKPYDADELTARIKRLLQKNTPKAESPDQLIAGDVVIDLPKCEVWVKGKVVDQTFTEYELIKLLVSKKGAVLTREVLLNKIWGYDYFGGDRTVDVHITRLRNKIEDSSHSVIETVRNIGYRVK